MTVPEAAPRLRSFLRLAIGIVLIATAAGKFLDLTGFAHILGEYRAFPEKLLPPLAVAVPSLELLLGVWLFTGRNLRAAALASAALHFGYAAWSAISVQRGLRLSNCGCFGIFLARPLGWSTVVEDLAMVTASLGLFALAKRP